MAPASSPPQISSARPSVNAARGGLTIHRDAPATAGSLHFTGREASGAILDLMLDDIERMLRALKRPPLPTLQPEALASEDVAFFGTHLRAHCRLGETRLIAHFPQATRLAPGDEVPLAVAPSDVAVLLGHPG